MAKQKGVANLDLYGLTSINKDVAQELAKFEGERLQLTGLTSIDQDVLKILKSNPKVELPEKYRDKKLTKPSAFASRYRRPFKRKSSPGKVATTPLSLFLGGDG